MADNDNEPELDAQLREALRRYKQGRHVADDLAFEMKKNAIRLALMHAKWDALTPTDPADVLHARLMLVSWALLDELGLLEG